VRKGLFAFAVLIAIALSQASGEFDARTDANGVIRLLHIGKAWFYPGHPGPVLSQDPRISYYPVPAHAWSMGEEAFRCLRMYLPRSQRALYDNFDVVIEDGMDASHLRDDFQNWVKEGVRNEGMGFLMADDSSSFATSGRHTSWYLHPIGDILPVDDKAAIYYEQHGFHIIVEEEYRDHPLMRNLPWHEIRIWAHNRPWEREGATVLARMSPEVPYNRNKPVIVYWDYGEGRSVAYVHKWHGTPDFYRWKWHIDVLSHLIYFPARVPIPQDLELVHEIRALFNQFHYRRTYLVSTIDFADRFGANLRQVEMRLGELGAAKAAVDKQYVVQELEECRSGLSSLLAELDAMTQEVLEAKDRALFWIFMAEWLVVSGTSMVAGFLLWSLMVRRRLYKEVRVTKLIERE